MKNDTVIGIIGNTHGVKIDARPRPKAVRRNMPVPALSIGSAELEVGAGAALAVSLLDARAEFAGAAPAGAAASNASAAFTSAYPPGI